MTKHFPLLIASAMALSGCVATPTNPNFTAEVDGNYKTVADCAFLDLSSRSIAWTKTELESVSTTRLTLGNYRVQQGIIDFSSASNDRTSVRARMQPTIQDGLWEGRIRAVLDRCSA